MASLSLTAIIANNILMHLFHTSSLLKPYLAAPVNNFILHHICKGSLPRVCSGTVSQELLPDTHYLGFHYKEEA